MAQLKRQHGRLTPDERRWLDEIVRDHAPRLAAYVGRVYARPTETEDIVAETFCRAALNIAQLRASPRVDLYLLTIARNLCRDHFRRPPPPPIADERLAQNPDSRSVPALGVALERERAQALRDAVTALPQHLREVVVLRLSTNLKFEDIAALLQLPLGTTLSRMHAAVERLRVALGAEDV